MFIFTHWELIKHLTIREIKGRYKQSFLGFFWVILNPFFQMLIMSFVFSQILKPHGIGVPYPVFLYAGLLPWTFFATSLGSSMSVFIEDASLIKKIYFPREVLVLSTLLAKTFDFLLSLIIFVVLMIFFQVPIGPYAFLLIPLFLIQFLFTYALSLMLATMNLFYRDVQYLFNLVITLWFYLTPIVYAVEFFPEKYRWIFKLNPMSVFINAYRQVIFNGTPPNLSSLALGVLVSAIIFFLSYKFYSKVKDSFADIV